MFRTHFLESEHRSLRQIESLTRADDSFPRTIEDEDRTEVSSTRGWPKWKPNRRAARRFAASNLPASNRMHRLAIIAALLQFAMEIVIFVTTAATAWAAVSRSDFQTKERGPVA